MVLLISTGFARWKGKLEDFQTDWGSQAWVSKNMCSEAGSRLPVVLRRLSVMGRARENQTDWIQRLKSLAMSLC